MVFSPPAWVPEVQDPPNTALVGDFALAGRPSRLALGDGKPPLTDGISGRSYSVQDLEDRVDHLARSLSQELGWSPNSGSPWDKVVAILALNTVSYFKN